MRALVATVWMFIGLSGLILHYGPGERWREMDQSKSLARRAAEAARDGVWTDAVDLYGHAIAALPDSHADMAMRLRLEMAKAQMQAAQLPEAREALESLLREIHDQPNVDTQLAHETRSALANSQYYLTWLMRLEGLPKADWEPEIESARQHYLTLSESATQLGDSDLQESALQDLEAAIRLARLDLNELQALPLPCQCRGCCSNKGKNRSKPKSDGSSQGAGFQELPEHIGS